MKNNLTSSTRECEISHIAQCKIRVLFQYSLGHMMHKCKLQKLKSVSLEECYMYYFV